MGKPNGNLLASFSGLLSGIKMDFLCFFSVWYQNVNIYDID